MVGGNNTGAPLRYAAKIDEAGRDGFDNADFPADNPNVRLFLLCSVYSLAIEKCGIIKPWT